MRRILFLGMFGLILAACSQGIDEDAVAHLLVKQSEFLFGRGNSASVNNVSCQNAKTEGLFTCGIDWSNGNSEIICMSTLTKNVSLVNRAPC